MPDHESRRSISKAEVVARLVKLLQSDQQDRRHAAAIVIGDLELTGSGVLAALREAIERPDDPGLRAYAARALGALAPKTLVQDLLPRLEDESMVVRDAAKEVLASGRAATIDDVVRMLESGDEKQRIGAIAVLGAIGTGEARRRLVALLDDATPRVLEALRDALLPMYAQLSGPPLDAAVDELRPWADPRNLDVRAGHILVELLSALDSGGSADLLMGLSRGHGDERVRVAAIQALRNRGTTRRIASRIFQALLDVLEGVASLAEKSVAADTLSTVDVPVELESRVRALVTAEEPPVRRWAIRALGALDSAPAARTLADVARTGDATDREVALTAAMATASGRNALAKALVSFDDAERASQVARLLREQAEDIPRPTLRALEQAAVDAAPDVARVVFKLLADCGIRVSDKKEGGVMERALKLKEAGRFDEALNLLTRLGNGRDTDPEVRFQLGVCQLKLSKQKIGRGRVQDPCVRTFYALGGLKDFPLFQRLGREAALTSKDLYFLGFSLAEGSEAQQAIGGDILMLVAESDSDDKLSRMAKNKLVTMGWLE